MDPFLPLGGERKAGEGGRQRKHKPNNLEIFQSREGGGGSYLSNTATPQGSTHSTGGHRQPRQRNSRAQDRDH